MKGISGGERRRTSIAFELVTDPSVILLGLILTIISQ